jgi:hypothetical protein
MLIAEDLLLLLTDDQSGKLLVPSNRSTSRSAALLVELVPFHRDHLSRAAADATPPVQRVRESFLRIKY